MTTAKHLRYRAASMELVAYLDDRKVEMRIGTDAGDFVTIVCNSASIFAVKRHIDDLADACPEMAAW
jgi:hypothetical protein